MHDPAGQQGKGPGDQKRTKDQRFHLALVHLHPMSARRTHRCDQGPDRDEGQDMDRAERPDHPQLVNPETAQRDNRHQDDPCPAQRAVHWIALAQGKEGDGKYHRT